MPGFIVERGWSLAVDPHLFYGLFALCLFFGCMSGALCLSVIELKKKNARMKALLRKLGEEVKPGIIKDLIHYAI